jgi:hypothetical protein
MFPPYPVNHDQVRSLTHLSTRVVVMEKEGTIAAQLLMEQPPDDQKGADEIHQKVNELMPDEAKQLLVSPGREGGADHRRLRHRPAVEPRDLPRGVRPPDGAAEARGGRDTHLYITGAPLAVGYLLAHSWEIGVSVLGAVAAIFFLLWATSAAGTAC